MNRDFREGLEIIAHAQLKIHVTNALIPRGAMSSIFRVGKLLRDLTTVSRRYVNYGERSPPGINLLLFVYFLSSYFTFGKCCNAIIDNNFRRIPAGRSLCTKDDPLSQACKSLLQQIAFIVCTYINNNFN